MNVDEFQKWIHSSVFPPAVVVIGTVRVAELVQQSHGLSLAELFAPFCGGEGSRPIPVSFFVLEKSMAIPNPVFRFEDVSDCEAKTDEAVEANLNEVLESHAPDLASSTVTCPPYPWFDAWFDKLVKCLRWSEGDCLDQPLATVYMVSTQDGDAVGMFEQLMHVSHMPSLCRKTFLDVHNAHVKVLVHDCSSAGAPSEELVEEEFGKMQEKFAAATCHRMAFNKPGQVESCKDRYAATIAARRNMTVESLGAICENLTNEDAEALESIAADVISQGAFPWMERRLQQLDQHITTTRKGLKNRFKSLWRPTSNDPASSSHQGYTLATAEGQLRMAGDLAFYMRDYSLALSYYRTLVSDLKSDKAWTHVGACYELSGICSFFCNPANRSEWFRFMDQAYENYQKARHAHRAVRCTVLCARMDRLRGREVALRCMRLHTDFPDSAPRSALFLEQASKYYLEGGSERKAMFHLVLAGHTFNKCALKQYALRSYSGALPFFDQSNWLHIKDHLHFTMGRQAFGLGMLEVSQKHFVRLLNSFSSTRRKFVTINIDREATYIRECLYVINTVREKNNSEEVKPSIELPALDGEPRFIFPEDGSCTEGEAISPSSSSVSGPIVFRDAAVETWETIGQRCISSLTDADCHQLRSREISSLVQTSPIGACKNVHTFSAVKQRRDIGISKSVFVELVLRNPFQNPLEITEVCLCATIDDQPLPPEDVMALDKITIPGRQSSAVRLQLVTSQEGILRIEHVRWTFFAQVPCTIPLCVPAHRVLEIKVCRSIPSCRAKLEGLPKDKVLFAGETRWCLLKIKNDGDVIINNFTISWYPSEFAVMHASGDKSPDKFSSDLVLVPGGEVSFDVLVRPHIVGIQSLKRVLRFCVCGSTAINSQRVWCTTESVFDVKPSILLSASRYAVLLFIRLGIHFFMISHFECLASFYIRPVNVLMLKNILFCWCTYSNFDQNNISSNC